MTTNSFEAGEHEDAMKASQISTFDFNDCEGSLLNYLGCVGSWFAWVRGWRASKFGVGSLGP